MRMSSALFALQAAKVGIVFVASIATIVALTSLKDYQRAIIRSM